MYTQMQKTPSLNRLTSGLAEFTANCLAAVRGRLAAKLVDRSLRSVAGLDYTLAPDAGNAAKRHDMVEIYMAMAHDIPVPAHLLEY